MVRYAMCRRGYDTPHGTPHVARASFDVPCTVMEDLGLTINQKKLVHPATQAVCL